MEEEKEKKLKLAQETYDTLCNTLDGLNYQYEKDNENTTVHFKLKNDDEPIDFLICCDAERQLIRLTSALPNKMDKEKVAEGAVVTSLANFLIADGSFDFDIRDGSITFRMTSSFKESLIGTELFAYMIAIARATIEKYDNQFFMLNNGTLSLDDFINNIQ